MSIKIDSLKKYREVYQQSIDNPSLFWNEIAEQFLWKKKWNKTLEYDWSVPETKWFLDDCNFWIRNCRAFYC